jgi:uncharacterized repeat protein (TIGR01451 family)
MANAQRIALVLLMLLAGTGALAQTDLQVEFGSLNGGGTGAKSTNQPFQLYPGGRSGYGADIRNLGPNPATNVTLTVTFPAGVTVESITAYNVTCTTSQTVSATTLTCSAPTLPVVFAAAALTFSAVLPPDYPYQNPFVATASLTASTPDPHPATNTMTDTQQVFPPPIPTTSDFVLGFLLAALVLAGMFRLR